MLNGLTDFIGCRSGGFQQIGQGSAIFKHRQDEQFGRNEFVRPLLRQLVAQVKDTHQFMGRLNVTTGTFDLRLTRQCLFDFSAHAPCIDTGRS
ncbi:hypothetical protein D3C80_2009780 [compost metagenome]